MRYLHTMVRVSNLDESLDFYCSKLGLKEVRRIDNERGRFTLVFLCSTLQADLASEIRAALQDKALAKAEAGVEILRLDHVIAAKLLTRFGERAIGHRPLALTSHEKRVLVLGGPLAGRL